ncbi:MAG: thioesterase family protein [Pseudomonadota bacterium]
MTKPARARRDDFAYFLRLQTRWMDNDVYHHVNNVNYYSYFDTVVNHYLMAHGDLDFRTSEVIGVVINSSCTYYKPLAFPDEIDAGLTVRHLGTTSVRYGVGIFRAGEDEPAAEGDFVHVFVTRRDMQKILIPGNMRAALEAIASD